MKDCKCRFLSGSDASNGRHLFLWGFYRHMLIPKLIFTKARPSRSSRSPRRAEAGTFG